MSESDIIKRQKLTIDNLSKQLVATQKTVEEQKSQIELLMSEGRSNWRQVKDLATRNRELKAVIAKFKKLAQNCGG